jgi:tRNA A-37 threonylcarbamoyl transferase component Bud32
MPSVDYFRKDSDIFRKQFADLKNPLKQQWRDFSIFDPLPDSADIKVSNERKASACFEENNISHAKVLNFSEEDGWVEMEFIDGDNLFEVINEENAEVIGRKLGRLVVDIHSIGYKGELNPEDFLYRNERIYSVDHEYFSSDNSVRNLKYDLITLEAASRSRLEQEKYREFIAGFKEEYTASYDYLEMSLLQSMMVLIDGVGRCLNSPENSIITLARNTFNF